MKQLLLILFYLNEIMADFKLAEFLKLNFASFFFIILFLDYCVGCLVVMSVFNFDLFSFATVTLLQPQACRACGALHWQLLMSMLF